MWRVIRKSRDTIPSTFSQVLYSEFYLSFWSIKMIWVCVGTFRKISKKNLIQTVPKGQRYNRFKLCNWSLEIFQQCFLAKLWQERSLSQAFDVRGLPDTSINIWHWVGYTIKSMLKCLVYRTAQFIVPKVRHVSNFQQPVRPRLKIKLFIVHLTKTSTVNPVEKSVFDMPKLEQSVFLFYHLPIYTDIRKTFNLLFGILIRVWNSRCKRIIHQFKIFKFKPLHEWPNEFTWGKEF